MAEPSFKDLAYRALAGTIGGPVDVATMFMRPFGYNVPSENVFGSSEYLGKKMEQGGLVSEARDPTQEFLASMAVPTPSVPLKAAGMLPEVLAGLMGLTAYHGTPHNVIGKFDLGKIGTGEGNQAYGEGIYFTQSQDLGNVYRRKLTDQFGNRVASPDQSIQLQIGRLEDQIKQLKQSDDPNAEAMIKAYENRISEIDKAGNLYKVDIPDEQIPMMLNWDLPLNQQPNITENLKKLSSREDLPKGFGQALENALQRKYFDGQDLYYELTKVYQNPSDLRKAMQESGFTGIRYLDAQSRGAKEGSSNFVVFDPSTVNILEKNNEPIEEYIRKGLLE